MFYLVNHKLVILKNIREKNTNRKSQLLFNNEIFLF